MCAVSVLCLCVINEAAQIKSSVRRTKSRYNGAEIIKKNPNQIMFLNKFHPMLANVLFVKSRGWKNNRCNQFLLLLLETSMQNQKVVSFPEWRSAGVMDLESCVWPNGGTSNSNISNDSKMVINEFNKMLPNRVIVLKLMNECINQSVNSGEQQWEITETT